MSFVLKSLENNVAVLELKRPKVNAMNEAVVDELAACFNECAQDEKVGAVIFTGDGKFFSFGLDIPEFFGYPKDAFLRFATKFANLYTQLFVMDKPVVAALNGHTVAGGCMLAMACDLRIMVTGHAKISLNEVNFGSSLFPGSAELLQYCVGTRNAEVIAMGGAMFSAQEAEALGLVDMVVEPDQLRQAAMAAARDLGAKHLPAYRSIKNLLRTNTAQEIRRKDQVYQNEMVDIWYSEYTRQQLQNIRIH